MFKLFLMISSILTIYSQDSVWVNCYKGKVFFRVFNQSDWQLIVNKEKIPVQSDLLADKGALFVINNKLESYDFDNEHFFYLKNLFIKKRSDLILELTKLDLRKLKSPVEILKKKKIGKTYGYRQKDSKSINIEKKKRSILHFMYNGFYSAALLEEKQLLNLYPNLYMNELHVKNMIQLLKRLELKGFLRDELNYISQLKLNKKLTNFIMLNKDSINELN